MSALSRLLDRFDAPRFCPNDGQPIEVRTVEAYDPRTGVAKPMWIWSCPDVDVSFGPDRTVWEQRGDHIHVHGTGRPRWHRRQETSDG